MEQLFGGSYNGKRVCITGHTGFKGSWLALWLRRMGAQVMGYALEPPTDPNHYDLLGLDIESVIADITDAARLRDAFRRFAPEIVFHLAAQPLVRRSYEDPVGTFATNVMGTLNVCQVCRETPSVRALVAITTDKVYRNREWCWGYRENEELGGHDPYSASKACADIMLSSYRDSYFGQSVLGGDHNVLLATARAGNVIGGGDWAKDRFIPDCMRAAAQKRPVDIRNPGATRPWQHVLECLGGYLILGQKLLECQSEYATAFNFGPSPEDVLTVEEMLRRAVTRWPSIQYRIGRDPQAPHEAGMLALDCSKARTMLGWHPIWNVDTALERTIGWYRTFYETAQAPSVADIDAYVRAAREAKVSWT